VSLHILRVPEHEHSRLDAGVKWCFYCRKHLPHSDVMMVPDDPMSYYGPRWKYVCSKCGKDATRFGG